jgi:hypothetical protein
VTVYTIGLKHVCGTDCQITHDIQDLISVFVTAAASNSNSHDFQNVKPAGVWGEGAGEARSHSRKVFISGFE